MTKYIKKILRVESINNNYLRDSTFSSQNVCYESVLAFLRTKEDPLIVAKDILFFIEADKNYPHVFIKFFKIIGIATIPSILIGLGVSVDNISTWYFVLAALFIVFLMLTLLKLSHIYKEYQYVSLIINDILDSKILLENIQSIEHS